MIVFPFLISSYKLHCPKKPQFYYNDVVIWSNFGIIPLTYKNTIFWTFIYSFHLIQGLGILVVYLNTILQSYKFASTNKYFFLLKKCEAFRGLQLFLIFYLYHILQISSLERYCSGHLLWNNCSISLFWSSCTSSQLKLQWVKSKLSKIVFIIHFETSGQLKAMIFYLK